MFKTGSFKNTALALFDQMSQNVIPEDIDELEAEWIQKASFGPIIWADIGYKGEGYKYDVNSEYPSVMKDSKKLYPFKKGIFKVFSQKDLDKKVEYGIYRCKVEVSQVSDSEQKLIRLNPLNYYTNIDIKWFQSIGAKVTIIEDGKANALIYPRWHCLNGNQYFNDYVKLLYELKKQKVEGAKDLLNILWGAFKQRSLIKIDVPVIGMDEDPSEIAVEIPDDMYWESIEDCKSNPKIKRAVLVSNMAPFQTNHARSVPFILSNGREKIAKIMKPIADKVVHVHTDGFVIKENVELEVGSDIGQLKYEGRFESCTVNNRRKVDGDLIKLI